MFNFGGCAIIRCFAARSVCTAADRYSNRAKQKTYIKHNKIYESLRHILCKLAKISYIEIATPANITIMTGDFTVGQGHCLQFAFEHISILMLPYFIISFIWKSQTISQNSALVCYVPHLSTAIYTVLYQHK